MASAAGADHDADGDEDDDDEDGDAMEEDDADVDAAAAGIVTEHPRDAALEAELAAASSSAATGYRVVAKVRSTSRFQAHMARISEYMSHPPSSVPSVGGLLRWPEYSAVLDSNIHAAAVGEEQASLHRYIVDAYHHRFPELEAIIPAPLDYIRSVRVIGNDSDCAPLQAQLTRILPAATVMVVTLTASSTSGVALDETALKDVMDACDEAVALDAARATLLAYVASRMALIAPNTVALCGSETAAQLMGIAGGMDALAALPGSTLQVLGQKKRHAAGMARAAVTLHAGVIYESELVQAAPKALRRKMARTLAPKLSLAARMDAHKQYPGGDFGASLKAALHAKLVKWQEPPPGRHKKALPAPDEKKSKRRGGRRARAMKEKMGMTDVRKEANRMTFGASSSTEYGDMVMGRDVGMLGEAGSGRLRVERKPQKILKKTLQQKKGYAGSSGATGGAASSLVLASSQGIELLNPAAKLEHMKKLAEDAAGYFSTTGVFSQIPRAPPGRKT